MGKRQIEAALRRKGLSCKTLEYGQHLTPGEVIGAWDIELDERSEDLVATADPAFDYWDPDCFNTTEALEWVASLPDCTPTPAPKAGSPTI